MFGPGKCIDQTSEEFRRADGNVPARHRKIYLHANALDRACALYCAIQLPDKRARSDEGHTLPERARLAYGLSGREDGNLCHAGYSIE